ncbi:DinB family protein [Actinocorallia sp. A-T 12471]|uniref:DinB family protein n=1 Tax=Actinocorallia sp. A-T 12471 TaxID=3089813 RepID=UPI0029CC33D0|nr:DinB family protein [Actinocorallia sp. A-T 12471]MDX6744093.1 DinB family protein [Actinocorallia sp. A-T 12471]
MPTPRAALLLHQLAVAEALLDYHLDGLGDAECLWEPSPTSWTVRPDGAGGWAADWADTEPDPVPTPTIAWLMWHIDLWWTAALRECFGVPGPEMPVWPGSATASAARLRALVAAWRTCLDGVADADLDTRSVTLFGLAQPLSDALAWVTVELTKNVAEIGSLRLLYAAHAASRAR